MKFSRLIVLGIALGAGGLSAYLAGGSMTPAPAPKVAVPKIETVDVLIAKTDIPVGRAIKPGDIEWQAWPAKYASRRFIRKPEHTDASQQILGFVARAPFVAGEPIQEAKLVRANGSGYMAAILPAGMRAVSTQITPESGAGGFILPNDRVDVILTSAVKDGAGKEQYQSRTILTDVRVLAIDQLVAEKADQRSVLGKTATLELSPSDAEQLVLASRLGTLSLTLRSMSAESAPKIAANSTQTRDITIVRFGRASRQ